MELTYPLPVNACDDRVASTLSWIVGDMLASKIALEVGRYVERERVEARVHARVHLGTGDQLRWREERGVEGSDNP